MAHQAQPDLQGMSLSLNIPTDLKSLSQLPQILQTLQQVQVQLESLQVQVTSLQDTYVFPTLH